MATTRHRVGLPGLSGSPPASQRVEWLDGIRGIAAVFVLLHHVWLASWQSFPRNAGPWWLGWLLYGHLAVAVFIIVSGFSLALAPLRDGGRLKGGTRRFLRRRAWRILPAYWAALVLSTVVTGVLLEPQEGSAAVAAGFVVHGLLLQDVIGSHIPNGTFWSIAVEWQIYFLFPLMLLLARARGIPATVAATVAVVVGVHELGRLGAPFAKVDHLTPQFLALFALGVVVVHVAQRQDAARLRRPLAAVGLAGVAGLVLVAATAGSVWMVARFFWVDLAFGAAVACLLIVLHSGGGRRVRAVLSSRPGRHLGRFSFSIYLVHGPLVGLLAKYAIRPLELSPAAAFAALLTIGLPAILALCWAFHLAFEAPFLRCRDLRALRALPVVGLLRRAATVTPAAHDVA